MGEQRRCQAEEPVAALLSSWRTMFKFKSSWKKIYIVVKRVRTPSNTCEPNDWEGRKGGGDCNCKLGTQNWPLRGHPFYTSAISAKPTDQDRTLGFLLLQRSFQPCRPGCSCTCIRCLVANCSPDEFLCFLNKAECLTAERFGMTI